MIDPLQPLRKAARALQRAERHAHEKREKRDKAILEAVRDTDEPNTAIGEAGDVSEGYVRKLTRENGAPPKEE